MKAWVVEDLSSSEGYMDVVYAETRGKAKALAAWTDSCGEARFVDISARRVPGLDDLHEENYIMDWDKPEDRRLMVKEVGMYCLEPYEEDCASCPAKDDCMQRI